ncbi:MAG: hypothetical protein H6582_01605 [Crocinitomicaceae bacterium]|nr:hypothetical protein [Crocinitomicaceae bacterium]
MFRFCLAILFCCSLSLYGQDIGYRLFNDSIETEYDKDAHILTYKDQKTGELFSGILYQETGDAIHISQIKSGLDNGFTLKYKHYHEEWRLELFDYYQRGRCIESIHLRKNKDSMEVINTVIYYFILKPDVVFKELAWLEVDYLKNGYRLTLGLKKSNDRSVVELSTKIDYLEQSYIPSIISMLADMDSYLILKSKSEIIFPKFLLN